MVDWYCRIRSSRSRVSSNSNNISGSERRPTAWRHIIVCRQPGNPWVSYDQSTLKLIRMYICQNSKSVVSFVRWPKSASKWFGFTICQNSKAGVYFGKRPHAWRHIVCGRLGIPWHWFSNLWQGKSDFLCFNNGTILSSQSGSPLVLF